MGFHLQIQDLRLYKDRVASRSKSGGWMEHSVQNDPPRADLPAIATRLDMVAEISPPSTRIKNDHHPIWRRGLRRLFLISIE